MPTYDYKCANCEHQWEEFQSITAKPLRKCPECGKLKAKRMIGPGAGIIFKGSGFYETDYRSSSYNKGAAADKKASESSSKSESGSKSSDKSSKSDSGSSSKKSSD
ncbi:MAG: zinc ribbon domain-containing protein [Planctomycetaceae bacterium]|nr:zinc ribbon domain-containing protein [Planctomycetaceae bacterium]